MVKSEADLFLLRVGERLRSAREAAGYSLRSAASKLDITHGAIGHWEKAVNAIDLRTLFTLAKMCTLSTRSAFTPSAASSFVGTTNQLSGAWSS